MESLAGRSKEFSEDVVKVVMNGEVQSVMDSFRRIVQALRKASKTSEDSIGLRAAYR